MGLGNKTDGKKGASRKKERKIWLREKIDEVRCKRNKTDKRKKRRHQVRKIKFKSVD